MSEGRNNFKKHIDVLGTTKEILHLAKKFNNKWIKVKLIVIALRVFWIFIGSFVRKFLRRIINFIFAFIACIVFFPLFFIIALLIKVTNGSPVIFKQRRVGRAGKPFYMWKFRTMNINANKQKTLLIGINNNNSIHFKMKEDPRIIGLGKWLRKTSIDELPQLWNVLRGEMVLVGPRPPLFAEVKKYSLDERKRLLAFPGMTGLWQISGRSDISFKEQVFLDEKYILQQSIKRDVEILLKTIPVVIKGKGAY